MQIIPAILEKDNTNLFAQVQRLAPYFKLFQIDIEDGEFAPYKSLSIEDILNIPEDKRSELKKLSFDFHLMVKEYEKEIQKLERLKKMLTIKRVFVHHSLLPNYQLLTTKYSFPIGLVVNPEDQIDHMAKHYDLKKIPFIQIMSIHSGPQGQAFIAETLNKIEQLRLLGYRSDIYLDGAINEKTIPIILSKKYRPDFLCIGSFLTKTNDLTYRIKYLDSITQNH